MGGVELHLHFCPERSRRFPRRHPASGEFPRLEPCTHGGKVLRVETRSVECGSFRTFVGAACPRTRKITWQLEHLGRTARDDLRAEDLPRSSYGRPGPAPSCECGPPKTPAALGAAAAHRGVAEIRSTVRWRAHTHWDCPSCGRSLALLDRRPVAHETVHRNRRGERESRSRLDQYSCSRSRNLSLRAGRVPHVGRRAWRAPHRLRPAVRLVDTPYASLADERCRSTTSSAAVARTDCKLAS